MALNFLKTLLVPGTRSKQMLSTGFKKTINKFQLCRWWWIPWISIVVLTCMSPLMAQQSWKDYGTKTINCSTLVNQNGTTAKVTITLSDTSHLAALHVNIVLPAWLRATAMLEFDKLTGPLTNAPSALTHFSYQDEDSNAVFIATRPLLDLVAASDNEVSFDIHNIPSGHGLEVSDLVVQCDGIVIVDHVPLRLANEIETMLLLTVPNPAVQVAPTIVEGDFLLGFACTPMEQEVAVFDAGGQQMWTGILGVGEQLKVESSGWPKGTYFVCSQRNGYNTVAIKLVKI